MSKNNKIIITIIAAVIIVLAWAPWLNHQAIHDQILQERGKIDGTIDVEGNLICDYNVMWAPFGRWVASCEGGYYVTFLGKPLYPSSGSGGMILPPEALSVAELLENPVNTEIRIYGEVSLLGKLRCPCFELTSAEKSVMVWYAAMTEPDGTERPPVSVEVIRNDDKVIVTGELRSPSVKDFWVSDIEKIE